ncbi:hypothetical protein pdam_00025047 [Pocillopora damicornis]|uniref:Uncharacterized protein n=1 Tax=Pocillopora damicornis TaxID=46731 RepID=A0A3M6UUA1_POCDA|nr:hypothetical protein pdam_00025047 [Pocillopora damicornis]
MSLIIHHVFVFEYKGYIFIIEKVVGFFQDYQTSEISPTSTILPPLDADVSRNYSNNHSIAVNNKDDGAVIQNASGETDAQPKACGSFERIQFVDDSSFWAGVCSSWRKVKVFYNVDKWGHSRDQNRLYDQSAFEVALYHWNLWPYTTRWDCDDWKDPIFREDFWKVFVR